MFQKPSYEELEKRVKALEALQKTQQGLENLVEKRTKRLEEINRELTEEIEQRKLAEKQLSESKELLNNVFESMSECILVLDTDYKYTYWNKSMERTAKISKEDILGKIPWEEFSFFRDEIKDAINRAMKGDAVLDKEIKYSMPEGKEEWTSESYIPLKNSENKVVGIVGVLNIITERKQTEEALRESELQLREIASNIPGVIYQFSARTDGTYGVNFFSGHTEKLFGFIPEPYRVVEQLMEYLPIQEHDGFFSSIQEAAQNFELWDYEFPFIKPSGEKVWMRGISRPIQYENEIVFNGVLLDVTEQIKAKKALREAHNIINRSPAVVFLWKNAEGWPVKFVSENVEALLGYTAEELISGKVSYAEALHPDDLERVAQEVTEYGNDERKVSFSHEPYRIITKNGETKWLDDMTFIRRNEKGVITHFHGLVLDISKRINAEDEKNTLQTQLLESKKMEAIGTLAGGIAHEFNNILAGLIGYIELLQMETNEDETTEPYFEGMKTSTSRMANLTSQLLAYARGGKYIPKDMSLNQIVEYTLPLIKHEIGLDIDIETNLGKERTSINADLAQMQLVLSALLMNAVEAMDGKGTIKVTSHEVDIDREFCKHDPDVKPGRYACLTAEDNGIGMDDDTLNRIFDPFFTTKFQGRGLGMAAVYGIINNHDGFVMIDSEPGKGTTVRIYLPAIEKEIKEETTSGTGVITGTGTLLVIEDEEIVMEVTSSILRKLGYHVLEAKTGKEAIDIAESFDGNIDLALLDIKLPDMDGGLLYPIIKKARPDLKVIVCSGYAIDGPAQEILEAGAHDFLQKPYSLEVLSEKLKNTLAGSH